MFNLSIEKKGNTVKEFNEFKEKYDNYVKYSVKQVGRALEGFDDFDEDELYGMMTTLLKKSMDLADSAMDLVQWQCETLKHIDDKLEEIEKKVGKKEK